VTTPQGTYNALRIKSELQISDSIYYESLGFGMRFPHTETHYIWLTNDMMIPVFTVEERGPNFGGTIASWADTLMGTVIVEQNMEVPAIFPNPVSGHELFVNINNPIQESFVFVMYDIIGREQMRGRLSQGSNKLFISGLSKGMYFIRIEGINENLKFTVN